MNIVSASNKSLEFDKIAEILSGYAKCPQSAALCLNITPYEKIGDVIKAQMLTREAKAILDIPADIPLDFVANTAEIEKNSFTSYLCESELVDIAKTLRTSRLVKNFLCENTKSDSELNTLSRNLTVEKQLEDRIFKIFDSSLEIKKDATPELKGFYASLWETEKLIRIKAAELLNSSDFIKHLQEAIYTTRDERIVFQVKASDKNKVHGIVHDVSATNKTFYIEPECIVPLNNKLREIKSAIHAEYVRILSELTGAVKSHFQSLKKTEQTLAEIDFHFAKARYAVKIHACEPEILENSKEIFLENMKHPLLIGTVENITTNDFAIGKDYKSVIITGSNTGGKTVTLKTIGLFILMTRAGLFLPCTAAKIYPFKKIFADIGDAQSILQSLSTFSSHMKNIIDIVNNSDEETFVLLDEICAGTDPVEGAVLAKSILEKLADNNVLSTVTTHYCELKSLEYSNPYFKNASVEFDTQSLKPTYKLLIGIPGLSNAIAIAANLGLDEFVVNKAKETMLSQKDTSLLVIENLQTIQQELNNKLNETEKLRIEVEKLKIEYEKNLSAVKKDKKKTVKDIKHRFDYELLEAKSEIKDILDELHREKSEKIARRSYSRLAKLENIYNEKIAAAADKDEYPEISWEEVKIHDKLILKGIYQPVEVLTLPDKKGNLLVRMGNIKTNIRSDKLAPYDAAFNKKTSEHYVSSFSGFELNKINISNKLDLRGIRVEEALNELEIYLDKASLANLSPVTIIHGHGTGALKAAVRDYLSTSPYTAKFRPGENSEGGDGVSIVDIR